MAPRISLVTPTFNRASTLAHTIASVAGQTGRPSIEYCVVDGGSTDGTVDLLKANTGVVTDWVSEPDGGMYHAIVKGFARTSGDILGWINSDDILFPWALDTVGRIFAEIPEVQWITTLTQAAIDARGDIMYFRKVPGYSQNAFFDGVYFGFGGQGNPLAVDFIQQESTFFRRGLWDRVGAPALTSQTLAGDFALWAAFMAEAPLVGVDAPLGAFRVHSAGQLSRGKREDYIAQCAASLAVIRKKLNYVPKAPPADAASYTGFYAEKRAPEDAASAWTVVEKPFFVLAGGDLKSAIKQRSIF